MIAEIYHKFSTNSEDVLTGCFFGTMRYLPFRRGLNQVFTHYAVSEDPQVAYTFHGGKAGRYGSVPAEGHHCCYPAGR